jgi:ribosome-binding factor A
MNITFKVVRKGSTKEWVVSVYVDGKRDEAKCYYTDDKEDAEKTCRWLNEQEQVRRKEAFEKQLEKLLEDVPYEDNKHTVRTFVMDNIQELAKLLQGAPDVTSHAHQQAQGPEGP